MGYYDRERYGYDEDYDRRVEARRNLERQGYEVRGNRFSDPKDPCRTGGHIDRYGNINKDM